MNSALTLSWMSGVCSVSSLLQHLDRPQTNSTMENMCVWGHSPWDCSNKKGHFRGNCAERDGGKSLKYTIVAMEVYNYGNKLATVSCFFPLSKGKRATALKHSLRCYEHKNEMRERERKTVRWKAVVGHKMQREKHRCGMSGVECSEEEFLLAVSD